LVDHKEVDGWVMWHVLEVGGAQGFLWGDLSERDHLEDGVDGRITLKWIFKKWGGKAWTILIWLRTGTGGRRL